MCLLYINCISYSYSWQLVLLLVALVQLASVFPVTSRRSGLPKTNHWKFQGAGYYRPDALHAILKIVVACLSCNTLVTINIVKAWFRKVEQLKHVSVLFDLFAVQPVHSQNHVCLRNANKMASICLIKFYYYFLWNLHKSIIYAS